MIIGIVCVDNKWGIGKDNHLLFNIKEDMAFFKKTTMNKTVVMGHNTLKSLPGGKPLKNRINVVICPEGVEPEGCIVFHDFNNLIDYVTTVGYYDNEIYIIGGATLYKSMLPYYDKVLVTYVEADGEAEVFFPNLDELGYYFEADTEASKTENGYTIHFRTYLPSEDKVNWRDDPVFTLEKLDRQMVLGNCIYVENREYAVDCKAEQVFFDVAVKYPNIYKICPAYKKVQDKILWIYDNIKVNSDKSSLVRGQMVYNASCTESAIAEYVGFDFGGGGYTDHCYTHTGWGIDEPDLVCNKTYTFTVEMPEGNEQVIIPPGTTFEVKDYMTLESAKKWLNGRETQTFHNCDKIIIHIISTNEFYLTDNRVNVPLFRLADFTPLYRGRQVKLWMEDGILKVDYLNAKQPHFQ